MALLQPTATAGRPTETGDQPTTIRGQPAQDQTSPHLQTEQDALAQDLALIATARGWTAEQAGADKTAADIVGRIAAEMAEKRPDILVGTVLSLEPGGAPALYIKGPSDDFVRNLIATAKIEINLVDSQPFSFDELEGRKLQVHHALETLGFRYVSTGFSVTGGGQITAEVTRQAGLPDDPGGILSALPPALRESVTLTVSDAASVDLDAFGGMQMRQNGVNLCTSGWSVWDPAQPTTGVTTAGHCSVNEIVQPGASVWSLSLQAEHRGAWGDVEWHTTSQIEPAQFYADASNVRYLEEVEPRASISQGEYVCFYGRASNVRDCSLQVQNVSISCTVDGVFNDRLVLMNGPGVATNGDSGGGWSLNLRAYGSTKGFCPNNVAFSVADLYYIAIGVKLRLSHTLGTNDILWPGDRLTSDDGRFIAAMQADGNFVVYRNQPWTVLWASSWCGQTGFSNIHAVMQSDGNFVLYPSVGSPAMWATSWPQTQPGCISNQQTAYGFGVCMVMQNDGNLVMYKPGYGAVWASNSCCY